MASAHVLKGRATVAALAGALSATTLFAPRTAFAEAPEAQSLPRARKPIYDDDEGLPEITAPPGPSTSPELNPHTPPSKATTPSPTDRLAVYVRSGRLQLYDASSRAEKSVNDFLSEALRLETSFTDTIASLAPPRESGERLMPSLLYVVVASMAGSIVTRRSNFLFRFAAPPTFALVTAYQVIPITMRNVESLVWEYEQKYPALAENHIKVQERVTRFIETGKAHSQMAVGRLEDGLGDARRKMEEWVRQSKSN